MSEGVDAQRVDVWLWRARFFKTRGLATAAVSKGGIRLTANGVTRRLAKPSAPVREGDTLTLPVNRQIVRVEILALAERRGPASEAQALYRQLDDSAPGQAAGGKEAATGKEERGQTC